MSNFIIKHIDKPSLILSSDFKILAFNEPLKAILDENIILHGKYFFDVFPVSKEDFLNAKSNGNYLPISTLTDKGQLSFEIEISEVIYRDETIFILIFIENRKLTTYLPFFPDIFNLISDPISICSEDGEPLYQNRAFEDLLTYDIESPLTPSNYVNINFFLNDVVLSTRRSYSAFVNLKKNGRVFYYDVKKMPVFNYNGKNYIVTILRDINQLNQSQSECLILSNYLDAVNKVSSLLLRATKPQDNATEVLRLLGEATSACYALWYELKSEGDKYILYKKASWQRLDKNYLLDFDKLIIDDNECLNIIKKLNKGEPLSILGNDCINCYPKEVRKEAEKCNIKAKLLIPILKNGIIKGIIEFGRCIEEKTWNSKEIDLLLTGIQNFEVSIEKYNYNKELALFRQFIQESPGQWAILDSDFYFIFANKAFKEFYDINPIVDVRGKKLRDILPKEMAERDILQIKEAISARNTLTIDDYFENTRGEKRFLSRIILPLFKEDGNLLAVGVISRDFTELKKLKTLLVDQDKELSLLLSAINQLPVSIVLTDENGNIEYANPAFDKITGYTRSEYIGKKTNILKSGSHSEDFYKELWETISSGKIWTGHFINKKKDGSLYEEDATIVPVMDGERISGYIAIKEDVTEKIKLEQQLIQTQKLETAATLAGGMAHDFNNLIGSIQSILELMILKGEIEVNSNNLKKIYKIIERAKGITGQVLLITRPIVAEEQPLDINKSIMEILSILRETTNRKIQFETDLTPHDLIIKMDPSMFTQVLLNILINSIQAMPKGGVITIKTQITQSTTKLEIPPLPVCEKMALIEISDTGMGMDSDTLNRIFDPFFTTKPLGEGTGLGLTIVHRIIRNLNGNIFVESERGKGTKFAIYLPLLIENKKTDENEKNIPLKPSDDSEFERVENEISNLHIMIIDDEVYLKESLREGLEALAYRVTDFSSGLEAYNYFLKNPMLFDLIILDMNMPYLNGLETIEKIREVRGDIPAILITGYATDEKLSAFSQLKNTMILQKPFKLNEIHNAIKKLTIQMVK